MKRLSILLLSVLCTAATAFAYDFQSGDLYYNITGKNTVEVTSQEQWSSTNYRGLTTATIPETVTYNGTTYSVTSIGEGAFYECSSLTSITIPNSVTSIGEQAFIRCSSLPSITIHNSVTSIGEQAFHGCSSLTSITIPNSVTSIGYGAFAYCSALTSITIPNSVTSIGESAFAYCSSLTSVTIGNSVTSIGERVFAYCSSLTSLTIPNSVTSIGDYAFYECSSLTSIIIPNSVTSIGFCAFEHVPNIVYYGTVTGSPWGAKSINGYVDGYLVYADETKATLLACSSAASGEIAIPEFVTVIGDYAFSYCFSLTSITIPNSVTSIGFCAFNGCSSLTSLTIPNSVTSIENCAFSGCSSLTSITIPNSVTSIGNYAFEGCSALTSITCLAPTPPTCENYCFEDVPRTIPLYVPAESVEVYKAAAVWQEFYIVGKSDAPTAIKNALNTDTKGGQKIIRNGQVLILRNGETYDMMGQRL